ncbi:MAG: glutaminyl-tRNA synthase (glutamine-hydrolyzing) subunit B, partial [Desulfobacula sp. RIFOXYB2_FULL_45_6]
SQYAAPIAEHGFLEIETNNSGLKKIGITRIHMEEDAGKLIHDPARSRTLVDLNRTGVPLIEIVSDPDIRSAEEAGAYLRKLHNILKYIDVCDGNMEEGSFRCDANVSLRAMGQAEFGTRTELKNLNSFKHVEKAIAHEIQRQAYVLNEGKSVAQETRLWDPDKNKTVSMRGKEEAHDYRYFPDPDLTPLIVDDAWIKTVEKELPELPDEKFSRFVKQYTLSETDAGVLTSSIALADFFEQAAAPLKNKKQAANWVLTTVLAMLNAKGISITESPVSAQAVGKLLVLVETQKINASAAKTVFDLMVETSKDPALIVQEKGLEQVTDASELESAVMAVINENPEETAAYRDGKTKLFSFFMGQVMKKTKGKADPAAVKQILNQKF